MSRTKYILVQEGRNQQAVEACRRIAKAERRSCSDVAARLIVLAAQHYQPCGYEYNPTGGQQQGNNAIDFPKV